MCDAYRKQMSELKILCY